MLLPASLPALQLSSWPLLPELRKVGDVIPVWPQWADEVEQALRWDDAEQQAFSDPDLGPTHRTLALTQQSPPALHSWGNVFRPCPCGCRPQPFAMECLLRTGLRGVGVPGGRFAERPPPESPSACRPARALCLVGQMTSPMQALWVHAQIWDWAAIHFSGPSGRPLESLQRFQAQLLVARQDRWITPALLQGGQVQVSTAAGMEQVQVSGPTTAAALIQSKQEFLGPGLRISLKHQARVLPSSAWLHPQPDGPTYSLEVQRNAPGAQTCPCNRRRLPRSLHHFFRGLCYLRPPVLPPHPVEAPQLQWQQPYL